MVGLMLLLTACSTIPKDATIGGPPITRPTSTMTGVKLSRFTLGYSQQDVLNPYKTNNRMNLDLSTLLYKGLMAMDSAMTPQPALAESLTVNGLTVTATIRPDAVFSNGGKVTAGDVKASFDKAKTSPHYAQLLRNVVSAAISGDSVVFTLAEPDPHAQACFIFPILPQKQVEEDTPPGSGLYTVTGNKGEYRLVKNPHSKTTVNIETIYLADISDSDALIHALENGTISYMFSDLSGGEIPRVTSANKSISMPDLLFLGVNGHKTALSNPQLRQAISHAIDRTGLANHTFGSYAEPACTPFHPQFKPAAELKGAEPKQNLQSAVALLEQLGYNGKVTVSTGKRKATGKTLTLELLFHQNNDFHVKIADLTAEYLQAAGIQVTKVGLPFTDYTARITSGRFDLYVGEVRLAANMSLAPLLSKGGQAAYGVDTDGAAAKAYAAYLSGEQSMAAFTEAFLADMPYIPLCWKCGMAVHSRAISNVAPTAFDVYSGIQSWDVKFG